MTRLTRALRDERGITLTEILVATVVISIGLVGLAVVIPLSSDGVHEGSAEHQHAIVEPRVKLRDL